MPKSNIQTITVSNQAATIIFGISILLTGIAYFFFGKLIRPLLPGFLPGGVFWVYIIGTAFILAGIAIIINKQITQLASYLLAILLFCVAVGIDLRGIFNLDDKLTYLFVQSLLKDGGLIAGALIIANFERETKHRHGRHRRHSSSRSQSTPQV
jgi:putative oxidoreductase